VNIYSGSIHPYCQLRKDIIPTLVRLPRCAMAFYLPTLDIANQRGKPTFTVTAEELRQRTGLSKDSMTKARKELQQNKLLRCEEVKSGLWKITLPVVYRYIDLETLKPDEVEAYFLQRLEEAGTRRFGHTTMGFEVMRVVTSNGITIRGST
jgi:hypothetical protein